MNSESLHLQLILASSSKYRKLLLQRLGIAFTCQSPAVDESTLNNEHAFDLVRRLARQKAENIARKNPKTIVIGSDQVAVFDGEIIGKPGTHEAAMEQLSAFSGQVIEFLTAVSVRCYESDFNEQHTDRTRACFRTLQQDEIKRYLSKEKPFDCAGSFKAESLGIALFERIDCEDPTALIGLPLIHTAAMLRRTGLQLP